MAENKKVITRSLVVLFVTLAIAYSLTYKKKITIFRWDMIQTENTIVQTWSDNQNYLDSSLAEALDQIVVAEVQDGVDLWGEPSKPSWVTNSNTQTPSKKSESSTSDRLASTNPKMLPGTTEYFWVLDIVGILWVKPQFTLQDDKWNYFAYYGSHLDFVQTIQSLGGSVYEMLTEAEILENQLFWDKVSYINLSVFKDTQVLMVIEIDGDVWLLQVPANKYHYTKDYLKSLFIQ